MWTAKRFRKQAATCAAMAHQTHDEGSRQRYLRLEQTYLDLAETDEQMAAQLAVLASARENIALDDRP
jgi:hypothetical protein